MPGPPLTPDRWRIAEEILRSALDVPQEQRDALLQQRCGTDSELLTELRELLAAEIAASSYVAPEPGLSEETRRAGPFALERLIGRGGMGAVYLAHRADGQFEQKVAVKLIGLPFEIEAFRERFRRERQILAGLNHPNITRLIDGGVTDDDELYLAMEYVDGLAIDRYSQGRPLEERLHLFRQVCAAVQYAHQNLIIHRDIKPSNILVTPDGTAKLLDFGTAKLMEDADTTQTGLGLMTLAYASPEQLRGETVSTLTDVFSLGAVLFEILAGSNPFTGGLAERLARAEPPTPPDTLAPDLQQILKKALAAKPSQRYSSPEQLSEDIRRYLAGEPVRAHPPSLLYQSAKFIRRHAIAVGAAALLLLSLTGGIVATLNAQRRAERRFDQVRQLANYLVFDIHSGLQRLPGSTALEKQVVERSLRYLDSLAAEASGDRPLRLELAAAYQKLGDVAGNPFTSSLGDRKTALQIYPKAMALASSVIAQDPKNTQARQLLASVRLQYGGTEFFGGDRDAGKSQVQEAVQELTRLVSESPDDMNLRRALAQGLTFLAGRMQDGGGMTRATNPLETEKVYEQARAQLAFVLSRDPHDVTALRQSAEMEMNAGIQWGSNNPPLAIHRYRAALDAIERLQTEERNDVELRTLHARILYNLGWAQGQSKQYSDAIANIDQSGEILQAIAAADPLNTSALYQMSAVYRSRGIILGYKQDTRGAIGDFEKAAEIHRRLSEKDPDNTNYRVLRGELLARIGSMYQSLGDPPQAMAKTAAGIEIMKELASRPGAPPSQLISACAWMVETPVVALRDAKGALPFCERAVEKTGGKEVDAWIELSAVQDLAGNRKQAIATLENAIAMLPPAEPGKPKSRQRLTEEETLAEWKRHPDPRH